MEVETGAMCLQAEEHQDGQQPSLDGRATRDGFSSEPPERTKPGAAGLWTGVLCERICCCYLSHQVCGNLFQETNTGHMSVSVQEKLTLQLTSSL